MHIMNVEGIVLLLVGKGAPLLLGGFLGWRYARLFMERGRGLRTPLSLKDSKALLGVVLGTALLLFLFFLLRARPGLLWNLPEWVELYHQEFFQGLFLLEITFLAATISGVAFRRSVRRVWVTVLFSAVVVAAYLGYVWFEGRSIADALEETVADRVILQSSGSSCVAASMANVLTELGRPSTEPEMALLLKTSRSGTVAPRVLVAARRLGFAAERFDRARTGWTGVPVPSVIFVDHPAVGPDGHAVSLMRIEGDVIEVWDPLVGRLEFSREELGRIWRGRGIRIW